MKKVCKIRICHHLNSTDISVLEIINKIRKGQSMRVELQMLKTEEDDGVAVDVAEEG